MGGAWIRMCLPSIAPQHLEKFHLSWKPRAIPTHSFEMAGTWNWKKYIVEIILNFSLHLCPRLRNPILLKKMRWETTHRIQQAKIRTALKKLPRYMQDKLLRKKCCSTFTWFLIGKEKASARLIWSYLRPASSKPDSSASHGRSRISRFWQNSGPWIKKLPLNLAVQCQNDLQATLSRYRSRAVCESFLSPASTCDSGITETSLHCYNFCNKVCRLLLTLQLRGRMLEKKILHLVIERHSQTISMFRFHVCRLLSFIFYMSRNRFKTFK